MSVKVRNPGIRDCTKQTAGTSGSNSEDTISCYGETTDHDIRPNYVEILERNVNKSQERLF